MNDNMSQDNSDKIILIDKKAVRLFTELGMPKNLAKTLLYLSQIDECKSIDIEQDNRMRQPEVSVALQQLMKKGWITKREQRKKRKGRPVKIFKLAYPIDKIITKIEKEKLKEIENVKKDISILKNLIEEL